jgi:hypothetical protein
MSSRIVDTGGPRQILLETLTQRVYAEWGAEAHSELEKLVHRRDPVRRGHRSC